MIRFSGSTTIGRVHKMVITSEEVRIIDENCSELGISVLQLMENAGTAAAKIAFKEFPNAEIIAICCGTGNNGGDGMVLARHLVSLNKKVRFFLVGHKSKIRSEATLANYQILQQLEHSVEIVNISDSSLIKILKEKLVDVDLIVDALLGIGLVSEPYEPIKSAITTINNSKKPILSVDLPSGMWSDVPKKTKLMINADKIATFHDTKPCLTMKEFAEKTIICSIGVPPEAELFVGKGDLRAAFPKRKTDSHKGENGMVLVVGGSIKYSGAPVLASRAALRTGADLVITCIPQSIADSVRSDSPNMIVKSLEGDYLTKTHTRTILDLVKKFDSIVIGPGISENSETMEFVVDLLEKIPKEKTIVVDADALKAIKNDLSILQSKRIVLTPHMGEFKILFGEELSNDFFERKERIFEIAQKYKTTILLKGKYDAISDAHTAKINRTGHAGMTVGGTGDVLAGILGTLSSINNNLFRAASAASYLAGKAGELAAEDFGDSLLATDVIEKIPEVILTVKK